MAADPKIVDALRDTDLFSSMSRRALQKLAGRMETTSHPAGKQIIEQGGRGIGFHLIRSGSATVMVGGQKRQDLGPGDYFGEIALIDGRPRSATVTATTDLTSLFLSSWVFRPLITEEPELAHALLLVLCARLRAAEGP